VVEVPIVFRDRRAGHSKMDRGIVAEAIWQVPRMRFGPEGRENTAADKVQRRYTF
jgi:hypothetical protein